MASPKRAFAAFVIVNGHGGNSPAQAYVGEWMADHPECQGQISQLVERTANLGESDVG